VNNLTIRILVAIPAAAGFTYCAWLGGWYFFTLILLVTLLMQYELLIMGEHMGFKPNATIVYLSTFWIFSYNIIPKPVLFGGLLFLALCILEIANKNKTIVASLVSTPFFSLFVPLGMLSIVELRALGNEYTGFTLTILLFLLIWGNDVFAYFGGKQFGKNPLAPKISPNKTVEGFLSGFVGGIAGTLLLFLFLPYEISISKVLFIPPILLSGIFGPLGDLLESKMKRIAKIKDSSNIIPGHGGFLDRFDAILLTAPTLFIYFDFLIYFGFIKI